MSQVALHPLATSVVESTCETIGVRQLILASLLATVGVLATLGTWTDILQIALHDEEASHVWLVLPLAGLLIYLRRQNLTRVRITGTWVGPLLVALGWGVGHYGFNHATQSFWHFGALLVVVGCITAVLGVELCGKILPAILLLVFLVPMPATARQKIAIPLEQVTARAVGTILSWFPVAITRLGNSLAINGHAVRVAEQCNGMRMVFPLFLITYVFVFMLPLRWGVQAFLLLIGPAVAVLANIIRLIPTVFIFGYASESAANYFHEISGWLMLPITFVILMGLLRILKLMSIQVNRSGTPASALAR